MLIRPVVSAHCQVWVLPPTDTVLPDAYIVKEWLSSVEKDTPELYEV
jgi:hypothetical protein